MYFLPVWQNEEDFGVFTSEIIERSETALMMPPNALETDFVIPSPRGETDVSELEALLCNWETKNVPSEEEGLGVSCQAFRAHDEVRQNAGLNFADCVAHATAKLSDAPLLTKSGDFLYTDVQLAG